MCPMGWYKRQHLRVEPKSRFWSWRPLITTAFGPNRICSDSTLTPIRRYRALVVDSGDVCLWVFSVKTIGRGYSPFAAGFRSSASALSNMPTSSSRSYSL